MATNIKNVEKRSRTGDMMRLLIIALLLFFLVACTPDVEVAEPTPEPEPTVEETAPEVLEPREEVEVVSEKVTPYELKNLGYSAQKEELVFVLSNDGNSPAILTRVTVDGTGLEIQGANVITTNDLKVEGKESLTARVLVDLECSKDPNSPSGRHAAFPELTFEIDFEDETDVVELSPTLYCT